jgi:hypothetical protein
MANKKAETLQEAVLRALQYTGRQYTSGGSTSYNASYSPNNIKALVLSPSCSFVTLHYQNYQPEKVSYNLKMLVDDFNKRQGKPKNALVSLTGTGLKWDEGFRAGKTQNIEYIFILTGMNSMQLNGIPNPQLKAQIQQYYTQMFTKDILAGFSSSEFKRFKGIVILPALTVETLNSKFPLLFKDETLKDVDTLVKYLQSQGYSQAQVKKGNPDLTAIGGNSAYDKELEAQIKAKLSNLNSKLESQEKEKSDKEATSSEYEKALQEFKNCYDVLLRLNSMPNKYESIFEHTRVGWDKYKVKVYPTDTYRFEKNDKAVELIQNKDLTKTEKEKENIKALKGYKTRVCNGILNTFIENLKKIGSDEMNYYVLGVMLDSMNGVSVFKPVNDSTLDELFNEYGITKSVEGVKLSDCIANLCRYYIQFFINVDKDEYSTKDYWYKILRKEA